MVAFAKLTFTPTTHKASFFQLP